MNHKIISTILLLIIVLVVSCNEKPKKEQASKKTLQDKPLIQNVSTSDKNLTKALTLLKAKKYQKLFDYLNKIPVEKRDYKVLTLLGESQLGLKKYEKALIYFKKAIQLVDTISNVPLNDKVKAHYLMGYTHQKLKHYDEALKEHKITHKYMPKNPLTWCNIGHVYSKLNDYKESEKAYKKAYKLNPNLKTALIGLGRVSLKLKKYHKTVKYYQKLIQIDPKSVEGHLNLGKAFVKLNQKAKGYQFMSKGYYLSRQYDKAVKSIQKNPNYRKDPKIFKFYIASLIASGQVSKALKANNKGIKNFPNDDEFVFNHAQILFGQKKFKMAIQVSINGLKQFPHSHLLNVVTANSYLSLADKDNAAKFYNKAIATKEDDIQARQRLAQIHREKDNKSQEYFHQGVVYFYTGEFKRAKEVMSWVKSDFNQIEKLTYYKGMILWGLNKKAEALKEFKKSLKANDKFPLAYIALSRAYISMNQRNKGLDLLINFMKKNPNSEQFKKIQDEYRKIKNAN